ncbi:MAG: aminoacyl-tRNA hydrolase [Ignavibacteria bacterium RBG_16_34_14]|nr:MAG: aminoacyl-tRNA hydrolase [Ignavibacteria bacterium RBG_16_34_14]
MRILFGVGNHGKKYSLNRHNAGYILLDYFAEKHSLTFKPSKFDFYYASGDLSDSSYLLVKPTTYVNSCGIAAMQVIKKFEVNIKDFLVVYDDFNLKLSTLRIRLSGGDSGHNGLSSIIYHLNSDQFPRLRIGIGDSFKVGEMADYVLANFKKAEQKILLETYKSGVILLEEFLLGGINKMLDAHSRLSQQDSETKKDISNQSKEI